MKTHRPQGPIEQLQSMLRTLAKVHPELPYLRPSGCFDEHTLEAVMVFQKQNRLPVTGTVDRETWEAIAEQSARALRHLEPPRSADLFPFPSERIEPGQATPLLLPIQGMLRALSQRFAGTRPTDLTGVLDEDTASDLRWVQRCGGLPETGTLDRESWELLSRLYETFVSKATPHNS